MKKNRGYTITELLVIMTMVAIAVALVVEFKRSLRPEYITAVSFNPDGTRVQASLADGSITAWDVATGKQTAVLAAPADFQNMLGFSHCILDRWEPHRVLRRAESSSDC
jgi:WD40 repeat protein